MDFSTVYKNLNPRQREAVDTIEGPLLVIAGPGTGKTQLLSARTAHILEVTDTLPQNILCLTFTENGALNMRDRLTRFIGQAAYDVQISTYHAFGGDIIQRFPQYFSETRLQAPIDELGKHEIVRDLIEHLGYDNPLKQTQHHLGDLIATISELKRALLGSDAIRAISAENMQAIEQMRQPLKDIFANFTRMPTKLESAQPYFEQTLQALTSHIPKQAASPVFGSLTAIAARDLETALAEATNIGKATPLTKWKNAWLAKDSDNHFVLAGELESRRMAALANVLDSYQTVLAARGLYDFDDMIIRVIQAFEQYPELRYSLQEQYLYIMLDEFQDTNAAQLRLVELLTDNPVLGGRPNVMAVGDDDQAIYAFQGAQYSNMIDFYRLYQDVTLINLTENYRSAKGIIETAHNIAEQIEARLVHNFATMQKQLLAANKNVPAAVIERQQLASPVAQSDWVAGRIAELTKTGVSPNEIAVLAPRHKQLEPLVAHLNARGIPVRYEKRENILEAPIVRQLIVMSRLVIALHDSNEAVANALWPEVLSFDFWGLPVADIWEMSWQIADTPRESRPTWSRQLLASEGALHDIGLFFLSLAPLLEQESLETMLDYLIGTTTLTIHDSETPLFTSPLREYVASSDMLHGGSELFYETLSHLTVLRSRLRDYAKTEDYGLTLRDFLAFIALYEQADMPMVNTSPYAQAAEAVQLMTVFKAKGLEFEHVFLVSCQDDVWGASSRSSSNKISLPANLAPIRHAGASDDERLRILFVALTRAKYGLHLTSYAENYSGKKTKHLKYFNEQQQDDDSFRALVLPGSDQLVHEDDATAPELTIMQLDWRNKHVRLQNTELRDLLCDRLERYQLSPTHLNTFVDLEYGGPDKFLLSTLLRFPSAPTVAGQYGNAVHETLEWLQHIVDKEGSLPATERVLEQFSTRLSAKKLVDHQYAIERQRGVAALGSYLRQRGHIFTPGNIAEANFARENVHVGKAWLSGKIDRMEIDRKQKTIQVVDYKTGAGYARWQATTKLHKYRQQLYCYKILIENSRTYHEYTVSTGRLEFIEPDKTTGKVHSLELTFDDAEVERTKQLLQAMWRHVKNLDFPGIQSYEANLSGIEAFEAFLLTSSNQH